MQAKIDSIHNNSTWSFVPLSIDKKAITFCWIYKAKSGINGGLDCYKAHLVSHGYEQKFGIDFTYAFALVVRWETIRTLTVIAIHLNWNIH